MKSNKGWAYHYGRILADRVYGISFSSNQAEQRKLYQNGDPVSSLSSHLNLLEGFDPNINIDDDPFRWIPQGLFYDLLDTRNELSPIIDNVQGYTNLQFFNALDNDIFSIQTYRTRLLLESGNNQAN
jgi:hypothetical protein